MSQFYSLLRKQKPSRGYDLNSFATDENYLSQSSTVTVATDCEVLPSPWDIGFSWSTHDVNTSSVFERLNSIQDDDQYFPTTHLIVWSVNFYLLNLLPYRRGFTISIFAYRIHVLPSSPLIIHRDPKYIHVSASDLHDQFLGKREFELDLFDALIRLIRQQDDQLYASFGNLRWRHFFESDFMVINVYVSFVLYFVPTVMNLRFT